MSRTPSLKTVLVALAAIVCLLDTSRVQAQEGGSPAPYVVNGDSDGDGKIDLTDVVYLANYLFLEGPPPAYPTCEDTADGLWTFPVTENGDINGDLNLNLTDVIRLAAYLFQGGDAPVWIPCETFDFWWDDC